MKNIFNKKVIDAGVMTGTTVLTSTVCEVQTLDNLGIQFVWTGSTVSGTLACQASNDKVTFSTFTVTLPTISASNGGNGIASIVDFPYKFIRFTYTNSSGTGVLNVVVNGKG